MGAKGVLVVAKSFFVDIDVQGNSLLDVRDAVAGSDGPNFRQVLDGDAALQVQIDALAPTAHAPAGAADDSIAVQPNQAISVRRASAGGYADNALTLIPGAGLYVAPPVSPVVDFPVDNILAGPGIDVASTDDVFTVSARLAPGANLLTVVDGELFVERAYIDDADIVLDAAIRAQGDRLDNFQITGTGTVTVTESGDNQWLIDVPAVELANTYTGPGIDSASINADLSGRGITATSGDLYINTTSGQAFLHTGLVAPGDWVALAAAAQGVNSVSSPAGTVKVSNPSGPVVGVDVSDALRAQIAASTSANTSQDDRLDALETASHSPAVSGSGGIGVTAGQSVSLRIDPASTAGVVSQGTAGVRVDVSGYATSSALQQEVSDRIAGDSDLQDQIDAISGGVESFPPEPVVLNSANSYTEVIVGPVGATVTVREAGGCVVTVSVCESTPGLYTVASSVNFAGSISFG